MIVIIGRKAPRLDRRFSCVYVCIYIYMYRERDIYICIEREMYIYIYIERERDIYRERDLCMYI